MTTRLTIVIGGVVTSTSEHDDLSPIAAIEEAWGAYGPSDVTRASLMTQVRVPGALAAEGADWDEVPMVVCALSDGTVLIAEATDTAEPTTAMTDRATGDLNELGLMGDEHVTGLFNAIRDHLEAGGISDVHITRIELTDDTGGPTGRIEYTHSDV